MFSKTYASVLAEDFSNNRKHTISINEFRKSPLHYKIWLLLLHNNNSGKETTMESIVTHLAGDSSRKTTTNILTDLEKKNLLTRKKDISDHRVTLVEPAGRTIQEFGEWIKHLKFELNSVEQ